MSEAPIEAKATEPSALEQREIMRGIQLQAAAEYRRQSVKAEKELKGLYVDFLFSKLNLNAYR